MKRLLIVVVVALSFASCKKKDTAPVTPSSLSVTGYPSQTMVVSSGMVANGGQTIYEIRGTDLTGDYPTIIVGILTKPTSNYTATIPAASSSIGIAIYDNQGYVYDISSGEIKVSISGSYIIVSFTNAVFTMENGTTQLLVSGSVTGS